MSEGIIKAEVVLELVKQLREKLPSSQDVVDFNRKLVSELNVRCVQLDRVAGVCTLLSTVGCIPAGTTVLVTRCISHIHIGSPGKSLTFYYEDIPDVEVEKI